MAISVISFKLFTSSFEEAAHIHVPTHCKRIGMYAAVLSAAERNGMYRLLIDHYGIQSANMLMDFCSYSIRENTSVAEHYPETMADQVLFSEKAFDDSWISNFFERILSEDDTAQFKKAWAMHCRELGVKDVWLCIDGPNNDCDVRDAEYAETGKNKTHTNKPVVGFMYAISSLDGLPVTYSVFRGSRVDSRQIYLMVDYLKSYDMQISGIILDRGFANIECMRLMNEMKYPFIIMLKEGTYGISTLFTKYGETINMAFEHCIDDNGKIFGIVEKTQVFKQYPDTAYIGLFYDSENGTARASHLIKKKEQKDILHSFGLSERSLELLALRKNVQGRTPEKDPVSKLPEEGPPKKNRGRPKGSKNKTKPSTDSENQTSKRRSPGRPKGSKNKKTILREAEEAKLAEAGQLSPKRGKGRPKGSKNKATIEREAKEAVLRAKGLLPEKRKPGRPKESQNKKEIREVKCTFISNSAVKNLVKILCTEKICHT